MEAPLVCYDCLTVTKSNWENCSSCGVNRPAGGWGLDPLIGLVLSDRYKIEGRIGEGGMGTVYKAYRTGALGGDVAIKVLSPQLSRTVIARRFEREARVVSQLSSPHVVRIYDFETFNYPVDGSPLYYIAMELVKGLPLSAVMRAQTEPVNFMWGVEVLRQTARGLDEAHKRGIVHRDLKPGNVMIIQDKRATHVKVLDFGIAAITDDPGGPGEPVEKLTKTGLVTGTPDYMAPEQAMGTNIGTPADMYSLGVMAFHMFTGVLPFTGPTAMAVLTQRVTEDPPSLAEICGDRIPASVHAIVDKLLRREPDERYQNAGELLDDLAQFPVVQTSPEIIPDQAMLMHFGSLTPHVGTPIVDQSSKTVAGPRSKPAAAAPAPKGDSVGKGAGPGRLALIAVLLMLLGGGGFAVYWFGIRGGPDTEDVKGDVKSSEKAASESGGPENANPEGKAEPGPKKTGPPPPLVVAGKRPALAASYEVAGSIALANGRTLRVHLPKPRPALHVPLKSVLQVDESARGLRLASASVTVVYRGEVVGEITGGPPSPDGRVTVSWPPFPLSGRYEVTVNFTLVDGTRGRVAAVYDSADGTLTTGTKPGR